MDFLGNLIVSKPRSIVGAALIVTAIFGGILVYRGIHFNADLQTLTRSGDDSKFYAETSSFFGDDRVIIIALSGPEVFTTDFIARLSKLTSALKAVNGVTDALSLSNVMAVRHDAGGVEVGRLIPAHTAQSELDGIKGQVLSDPLYLKTYVSPDGRTAAVNVFLKQMDQAETRRTAQEVEKTARAGAGGCELLISGVPVVDERGVRNMTRDMLVCTPLAALVSALIFLIAFRSFWASLLPMAAVAMGLVWTLGVMALMDRPITIATLSLPSVLFAIGGSYMFHVINQYRLTMRRARGGIAGGIGSGLGTARRYDARGLAGLAQELAVADQGTHYLAGASDGLQSGASESSGGSHRWLDGLRFILPAVLVSGLTTAAGFGALGSSPIPTARGMGLYDTLGVLVVLLMTLTFVPAALFLLGPHRVGLKRGESHHASPFSRCLSSITALIIFRPGRVCALFAVAFLIGILGIAKLRVNTNYLNIFPKSSPTRTDANKLHERLAGPATIEVVVKGGAGAAYDPAFVTGIERLESFVNAQPGIDSTISIADIIKRVNHALNPQNGETVPRDRELLHGIYRDFLSEDPALGRLVDTGGDQGPARAVIVVRGNIFDSNEIRRFKESVEAWSRANLSTGISARLTGSVILLNDASDDVARSQLSSLAIALAAIYLVMAILFGSAAAGLLAMAPNLIPVAGLFGFLGWSGIPLDITTSLVATSALGLAVDNAVHMIRRYRQCSSHARDDRWLLWLTIDCTGRPMILANITLIAAFSVFAISSFVPVRLAGILWAVTITGCLAADLLLLPILMRLRLFHRAVTGGGKMADDAAECDLAQQAAIKT